MLKRKPKLIKITDNIFIDEKNISFQFIRSGGPGGQNVNKVSTGAELRFDIRGDTSLQPGIKSRLKIQEANRISKEGILVISATEFRTQEQNKAAAMKRLAALIHKASKKPRPRKKTKPTRSSVERRISEKKKKGSNKIGRSKMHFEE
jgi:ribosome-associated protein